MLFNESTVSVCYPSTIKSPDQLARSLNLLENLNKNKTVITIAVNTDYTK